MEDGLRIARSKVRSADLQIVVELTPELEWTTAERRIGQGWVLASVLAAPLEQPARPAQHRSHPGAEAILLTLTQERCGTAQAQT
jgi:hypothetical protein